MRAFAASFRTFQAVGTRTGLPFGLAVTLAVALAAISCREGGAPPRASALAAEPSLFLRQRAGDAVAWQPWAAEAFREAAESGRPVVAWTGYGNCTECDALGRRYFHRRRVARAIGEHFVPVLVDRDARPDVDAYLMLAAQVLTGGAGWPAMVFLDAEMRPFAAASWGAASRSDVRPDRLVLEVARRVALGGGTAAEKAANTAEKMAHRATLELSGDVPAAAATADAVLEWARANRDAASGAFDGPPYFPRAPLLGFLAVAPAPARQGGMRPLAEAAAAAVASGGLRDAPTGGFRRFATGPGWTGGPTERMLDENAALALALLDVAAATARRDGRALAAARSEATARGAGVAKEDDATEGGRGNAASVVEGILRFLSRDLALGDGSWAASLGGHGDASVRDDRILAAGNALATSAFARASVVLARPDLLEAALAGARFLESRMLGEGGVAHAVETDGRLDRRGTLDDQAFSVLAFVDVAAASGDRRWLDPARRAADAMLARFSHAAAGGFFADAASDPPALAAERTAGDAGGKRPESGESAAGHAPSPAGTALEPPPAEARPPLRLKPVIDGPRPSGNAAAALALARLAEATGDERYAAAADRTLAAFATVLRLRPQVAPAFVRALLLREGASRPAQASGADKAPPQLDPAPAVQP